MDTLEIKAVRVWMRQVMEQKDWSAYRWAELAGTSDTNITRFLKHGKPLPNIVTLYKLARVAGSVPNFMLPVADGETRRTIPLFSSTASLHDAVRNDMLSHKDRLTDLEKVYTSMSDADFAVVAGWDHLNAAGVYPGDILTISQSRPYHAGCMVMAQVKESGAFVIGKYAAPYVMPQSTNPERHATPLDDVDVVGVIVEVRRELG